MLKAALLCSALCTAFVVGGRTSVSSLDEPAKVVKPVSLHATLKPFVGKRCGFRHVGDLWRITFRKKDKEPLSFKLDAVGLDYVRVSHRNGGPTYVPLSFVYVCID